MSFVRLHTRMQTSSPVSNCSSDDLVVKSWPLFHESRDEVVDVTDSCALDHFIKCQYFNDGSTDFFLQKLAILLKKYWHSSLLIVIAQSWLYFEDFQTCSGGRFL